MTRTRAKVKTTRRHRVRAAAAIAASLGALSVVSASTSDHGPPITPPALAAPDPFPQSNPCPDQGDGGDAALNQLKNRFNPVTSSVTNATVTSVAQMLALPQPTGVAKKPRSTWPETALQQVAPLESTGVTVVGYLIAIKQEGGESCNCHRPTQLTDFHTWITASPNDAKPKAFVAELTPRWQSVQPGWTQANLQPLITNHTPVRVTGWLMWDEEHPEQIGKFRATLWEIHPITSLEYQAPDGSWRTP